jgi:hypothetical protein
MLCRTYGALRFLCEFSQRFRAGLTNGAPTALVRGRVQKTREMRAESGRIRLFAGSRAAFRAIVRVRRNEVIARM